MLARLAPPATLADALLRPPVDDVQTALVDGDGTSISFAELRRRVVARVDALDLPARSVAVLAGDNSLGWVVDYLSLLAAGHVPLLTGRSHDRLAEQWGAQAIVDAATGEVRRTGDRPHDLHPQLALLVSTSGSTGSPKLVRLSHRNLVANATAIADYQRLTAADRGITSLPLHYCFGLSVLHSHLRVGAPVVVTDTSVVDPCFTEALRDHGVTNLAGVPHTYELMERAGPDRFLTPDLRLLTQAGGRLEPSRVAEWARRADDHGAEFLVMYGQTEATARMAYLPSHLAELRPEAIGVAIPGGTLTLDRSANVPAHLGADVGELVYEGPNVMMGYADVPADLGLGHEVDRLHTGDLARFHPDAGVFEIVGRSSRFVKPFGLRIALDQVERDIRSVVSSGTTVAVAGDDEGLVIGLDPTADQVLAERVCSAVASATGLPARLVTVPCEPVPRTENGKIDHNALLARRLDDAPPPDVDVDGGRHDPVLDVFRGVLGRADARRSDSFVSLGGDSLSYVECSIRLERVLGQLPGDWHLRTIADLSSIAPRRSRWARLDTSVLLRAVGICMVVATHMRVWHIPGGAHTLLAVAGYNVARFMAPLDAPIDRLRAGLRTAGRAALPTMAWVGAGMLLFGSYSVGTLLLVNNYAGPASHADDHWHFWFIEVFVHLVLLSTLLMAFPAVGRVDRRWRFAVPLTLLAVALVLRMEWAHLDDWYNLRFRTHGVAWFFALGWLIQRSSTWWQRAAVTFVCLATVPGFFRIAEREWRILALLLLLVWVRTLPVPRAMVRPIGVLAAASMWIYVSHFSIWPPLRDVFVREVAYPLTILAGVGVWYSAERLLGSLNAWRQGRPPRPSTTVIPLRGAT